MTENNRILIVDDDPGVRDSYVDILSPTPTGEIVSKGASLFHGEGASSLSTEQEIYDLTVVDRGEKGVTAVKAAFNQDRRFAVAFIDMKMQGIDGAETARRIWDIDPDMKIVIVTAYSNYRAEDITRVTGRDDVLYLRKPFNPDEIRQFARALTKQWELEQGKRFLAGQLKKANQALEDMNKDLQKKVKEQAALLIQSEKMAAIGLLAAGVAHEINNPMSFVSSNLSTLKRYMEKLSQLHEKYGNLEAAIGQGRWERVGGVLEEIRGFRESQKIPFVLKDMLLLAEESLNGTKRVSEIVRDLTALSRSDEAELKPVNLNELIDAGLHIIWNKLKHKAEVVKDYGDLPELKCFPQKLSQVFLNILMNAAQAIERKGVIKISTRFVRDGRRSEDAKVVAVISDTGVGIPKENISKVFNPFFTTKPVGQGTGLGLSIVYDIVKAHGGRISVDSEEGKGTSFTLTLPVDLRL